MKNISFFDYPGLYAEHRDEFLSTIDDCLGRGAYIMQKDLFEFENEIATYLGVKHVLGVADGTIALAIALRLAGVEPGDEVILPSHTFVATASAVNQCGGTPVLCDCKSDSTIDVESAEQLITERTKVIMPVQLNGRTSDMDAVNAFAKKHGLKIVEDSCQALGSKFKGQNAGTFGVAGSFSFYPAKLLGCFGDGGALVLDNDDHAQIAREIRDHGRNEASGKVVRFGGNARLDNLQAAIMRVKFRHYDGALDVRRALAARYQEKLGNLKKIQLPPAPDSDPNHYDVYQNYEIQVQDREALRDHLTKSGIGTIVQWGGFMVHQFDALGLKHNAPYAEEMSKRYMLLPMHHLLSVDEVDRICDAVLSFYR